VRTNSSQVGSPYSRGSNRRLGLWLIDNVDLTELAEACREDKRWDFFFAALQWRMKGMTSSASNPVAIF
jgi:hypothetical protein